MRELTVQVSDSQFDVLVNFLKTLPYVKLPSIAVKNGSNGHMVEETPPLSIEDFGVMDETPFDLDDLRENYTANWENLSELRAIFKDAPFDEMLANLD